MKGRNARSGDDVDRVRDAADIARMVGECVQLRPKGREFVGLCPFHDDHKPSMYVIPAKQIFHCFVCGAGGDVFSFVQKFHKMEFREALEFLADRFGVTLTPRRAESDATASGPTRRDVLDANQAASQFFQSLLRHAEHGAEGRAMIERRGISPQMVEEFQLGVSADRWDGLVLAARSKGLSLEALVQAGLLRARESGDGHFDFFRNRLMFPIHDRAGRVIAFGARRLDETEEPKYLNSPDTRVFKKSQTLYGLSQASRAIQREGFAVVTEGYTDTIACHQAGIRNVVATLGTALTHEHAEVLSQLCRRVVLLFDGDDAGQRAADRAIEVFFALPLDVRIATLRGTTDAKDPDELLKRPEGEAALRRVFDTAADPLDYRYARLRKGLDRAGPSEVSETLKGEIAAMVKLGLPAVDPVKRRHVTQNLARLAGVDDREVAEMVRAAQRGTQAPARLDREPEGDGTPTEPAAADAAELARLSHGTLGPEEHLLGCVLVDGSLWVRSSAEQRDLMRPEVYRSALVREVAQAVLGVADSGDAPGLRNVFSRIESDAGVSAAAALAARVQEATEAKDDRLTRHWHDCITRITLDRARERARSPSGSVVEVIEKRREDGGRLGPDRRVLPKPR